MTIAYYNGGVHVVDLAGLTGISLAGQQVVGEGMKEIGYYRIQGMDAWSAKTPEIAQDGSFHLYANDIARGLDVYRFDGAGATSSKTGTWMGAAQAAKYFAGLPRVSVTKRNALVCLLPRGKALAAPRRARRAAPRRGAWRGPVAVRPGFVGALPRCRAAAAARDGAAAAERQLRWVGRLEVCSVGVVDRGTAIALTLAVGAGFAMQAPINSALGRDIGPIPAATGSFAGRHDRAVRRRGRVRRRLRPDRRPSGLVALVRRRPDRRRGCRRHPRRRAHPRLPRHDRLPPHGPARHGRDHRPVRSPRRQPATTHPGALHWPRPPRRRGRARHRRSLRGRTPTRRH